MHYFNNMNFYDLHRAIFVDIKISSMDKLAICVPLCNTVVKSKEFK